MQEVLEKALSADDLGKTVRVVKVRGWLSLGFFILFFLTAIVWASFGTIPVTIAGECVVLDEEVLGFFPLHLGQKIEKGMEVRINLDVASHDEKSDFKGTIKEVFLFPVSLTDGPIQKIPSPSLREYLLEGASPKILVMISPEAPPSEGALGSAFVILERIHPFSYLFQRS